MKTLINSLKLLVENLKNDLRETEEEYYTDGISHSSSEYCRGQMEIQKMIISDLEMLIKNHS